MDALHKVEAFVILDADGARTFGKYFFTADDTKFPWKTPESQTAFERTLAGKIAGSKTTSATPTEGDVMLVDGHTVIFHCDPELSFFVVGPGDENELVLSSVMLCIYESLTSLLKAQTLDRRTLQDGFTTLVLVLDEIVDEGIVLETNSAAVVEEVKPYATSENQTADAAKKTLASLGKYIKQSL